MLELKTKKELATYAHRLAKGSELVRYRHTLYVPVDYETRDRSVMPDPERKMWMPLSRDDIRTWGSDQYDILFASDGELSAFHFMVAQNAQPYEGVCNTLLVKTEHGLKELRSDGKLYDTAGRFVANTLVPMLNTDPAEKDRIFKVISEWVNDDGEAESLLRHFATALAPGWSAVKYVMLLGEGRNGKSLLLKMLQSVFGWDNVSNVTRQQIAAESPVVTELNGKLLNIVFDGRAEYVKDSGLEKSLIAGEVIPIRRLYESHPTPVQTNALFVEGLNREPKSTDKSMALQKRLMRFHFPNVYALDYQFEEQMLSPESLGAFLSLLIDYFVRKDQVALELAPSAKAYELQLEHMYANSLGLQFLRYHEETDTLGVQGLIDQDASVLVQAFQSWRLKENDLGQWGEPDVLALFAPLITTDRVSKRVNGQPRKVRVVTALKDDTIAYLNTLKETEDAEEAEEVHDLVD